MSLLTVGGKSTFSQTEMFQIAKLVQPPEGIMTVGDHDDSISSGAYKGGIPSPAGWRCREYGFYHKDTSAPFGERITWIEGVNTYELLIPDVPVRVGGNEISLQKAAGVGIFDSIGLLEIKQDENLFTVSVADMDAVKVRVVDLMRGRWAFTEDGFPIASKPSSIENELARFAALETRYDENSNGWHGSPIRNSFDGFKSSGHTYRRYVFLCGDWFGATHVAIAGPE